MKLNRAQLLALNLDSHIVVDAGAGTGKTSTIIDRVIEHYLSEDQRATRILPRPERPFELSGGMLVSGKSDTQNLRDWGGLLPGEVVLLTFTNKAADEMKDRLRQRLTHLAPGPSSDDGKNRTDPRIRYEGFNEQLLTLLDDAPIGTIDSFFNQLVSPYRGILGDSLTQENISDSGRILLTESALNILWRLSSHPSRISEAVDAGISVNRTFGPKEVLESRDRIQRHYAGRNRAIGVIRNLSKRSIFIDEAIKGLTDSDGKIISDKIKERIVNSINPRLLDSFIEETQKIIFNFCDLVKQYPNELGSGWSHYTRIGCLDHLASLPPKENIWDKLVWLSNVYNCVVSRKSLFKDSASDKPSIFPYGNLPKDGDNWPRGINSLGRVSGVIKPVATELKELWHSTDGDIMLHFIRLTMVISKKKIPGTPNDWQHPIFTLDGLLSANHPTVNDDTIYGFTLEKEARNLDDLRIVMKGFNGILEKLKEVNEVHDFDDIQRMAGDLLLANCPQTCEDFYPESVIYTLNNPPQDSWKDDHIIAAISILEDFEKDSVPNIKQSKDDLIRRYELLKKIRRRYRAFIIDEAQDNSPLQWKLLSRLWGDRHFEDNEVKVPDTPWQPTICYVGDIKQSIYAFRQAEVTGFLEYSKILRSINNHEFNSISELTESGRELRSRDFSRDPRNSHKITIANARKHYEDGGQDLLGWIPFHHYDGLDSGDQEVTDLRKEGYISLKINYRTDGGLLDVMNKWWEDVFNPRHRRVFNGDFYAEPQELIPSPQNKKIAGNLEWICPLNNDLSTNPSTDLSEYLDAFDSGDSLERQGLMIAQRIKHLIDGKPVRVLSPTGDWDIQPTCEKVPPSEIMVLLPSRRDIRDIIIRYLNDFDIPSQADREGGLLERPAVHTLDGLLQFIARPRNPHNAVWVARSCLIGFNDKQTQDFIGKSKKNENLLYRLRELAINSHQKELVSHWIDFSEKGLINELLEDTLDFSDLLLTYPEESSLQDVEQFIELVSSLSSELGGDAIVIADKIRQLRENESSTMEAITIPPSDAVRIMTIHGSKGLEASVVFLVDIFSKRQTNLTIDSRSRAMVSPELFSGNPIPWTDQQEIKTATWMHTKWIYQSRKDAEARRLFYVGATRAKNRLIIVGSPKGTSWSEDNPRNGLKIPWSYTRPLPQLGQIWLESLRQGSVNRNEDMSIWTYADPIGNLGEKDARYLNPFTMIQNSFLGSNLLPGIIVLHDEDCFNADQAQTNDVILTPFEKLSLKDNVAKISMDNNSVQQLIARKDSHYRVKTAPHRLSVLSECSRRHWFETRGGLNSTPIIPISEQLTIDKSKHHFDPALFGSVVHRIVEIGIPNPGSLSEGSPNLPSSWIKKNSNGLNNPEVHQKIYSELLDNDFIASKMNDSVIEMTNRLSNSKLGRLVSGEIIDDETVEGLRTELPFHISFKVPLNGITRGRWTPRGTDKLSSINEVSVLMDGLIDLVLCTNSIDGPSIRPIDLKTEEVSRLFSNRSEGLLESLGDESYQPACEAEYSMLHHHRMQLALYYRALERIEQKKAHPRRVLRPAIWVGVTGRLVEYPEDLFLKAQKELDEILIQVASIELNPEEDITNHPPLNIEFSGPCNHCPFSKGKIPICGPSKQEL
ncbi:MAG: hypothetical protein CMA05_05265 [Euryarchaeota archaeon]|nr:hypothetical protein [Euryarchaeota archaeon]